MTVMSARAYWAVRHQTYPAGPDRWIETYQQSAHARYRRQLLDAIAVLAPFQSVYEVGCHCGTNLQLVAERWPGVRVGGCDINRFALHRATDTLGGDPQRPPFLQCGDARTSLNWRPRTWDVVISCYALCYVDPGDIQSVLHTMQAMSVKGIVLAEPQGGTGWDPERTERVPDLEYAEWLHDYPRYFPHRSALWRERVDPPVDRLDTIYRWTRPPEVLHG